MPTIIVDEDDGYGGHHHHRHHHRRHGSHHSRWHACFPCLAYRKPRFHSTARYHFTAVLTFVALLFAFVLYLLPALSLPIIKAVYLMQINFATPPDQPPTSVATNLRFGVWGFCASSVVDLPTIFTNHGECTKPELGYDVPPDVLSLIGFPVAVSQDLLDALKVLLVLHPVSAGLSFVTLFFSVFVRSQAMTVLALIFAVVAAIVGSVSLGADLALIIVATDKVHDELGSLLSVTFGPAVWMVVAAVALSWIGVITLSAIACRCCGIRRKHGWYGDGYYG
ncbi:SUR7/PalI family protein [Phanerochaete sordida]|uniref:SUR7/PalI family protein n=1 Tax=Phanerochaete sordida TaxID=48140 RepID=A0A9P3GAS1_9APHY|nr:SUR7/PalI family protein [Phanerochaete sordida]